VARQRGRAGQARLVNEARAEALGPSAIRRARWQPLHIHCFDLGIALIRHCIDFGIALICQGRDFGKDLIWQLFDLSTNC
jgi:hypothetical protein